MTHFPHYTAAQPDDCLQKVDNSSSEDILTCEMSSVVKEMPSAMLMWSGDSPESSPASHEQGGTQWWKKLWVSTQLNGGWAGGGGDGEQLTSMKGTRANPGWYGHGAPSCANDWHSISVCSCQKCLSTRRKCPSPTGVRMGSAGHRQPGKALTQAMRDDSRMWLLLDHSWPWLQLLTPSFHYVN